MTLCINTINIQNFQITENMQHQRTDGRHWNRTMTVTMTTVQYTHLQNIQTSPGQEPRPSFTNY